METTRVDRWLWAVRLTKTRADAAAACRGGHVRVNDQAAKPATPVRAGDTVRTRVYEIARTVEVSHVIEKRVGAPVAVTCYVDHTPPPPEQGPPVARRERGAGRPTKRDRRRLDAFQRAVIIDDVGGDLEADERDDGPGTGGPDEGTDDDPVV